MSCTAELNSLMAAATLVERLARQYNELDRRWTEIRRGEPTLFHCLMELEGPDPASEECIDLVAEHEAVFGQLQPLHDQLLDALDDHLEALLAATECIKKEAEG